MKRLYNPSSNPVTVYYGHTPYFIGPRDFCEVEEEIALTAVQHKDYSFLKIVPYGVNADEIDSQTERTPFDEASKSETGGGEQARKTLQVDPWTSPEWNPLEAPIEDVKKYANLHGIKVYNEENIFRQSVEEHFMSLLDSIS